ncbi:uncharacterized MFS-type transporter C330.07c [Selaginella moellendorffii]|uniref:uncharacterized MFS-type transporter C330.07c n=1 Tax=Selaginella moellendorffii TaxID=88036 RepID=UPI000D1CA837|nr:uncharacterized MFS-type transporter C330.07c [Selaginella moellendorffii]|eukprot:XP_024545314.1 uncharacterized MFS-type transporter C330.07c [Selaginella moellendorffii]
MSLCIILSANFLFNLSFFIIVPTATSYTKHLGGESLFSGLTVGVVTLVSFILVIPLSKLPKFKRKYSPTLDLSSACLILGHIIADRTGVLYLVLLGRMINGIGLTGCFFLKRYCTDPCIVGVRRRTTCTSLLILAQPLGMVPGPIVGGFLARIPMKTALFNKNTLPGWFMAVVWSIYWLLTKVLFKDVTDTADQLHEHHDSRLEVRDSKYDARSQCAEGEGAREASQLQQQPDSSIRMSQLEVPRFARWFLSFQRHHGQVRGISRDSRYDTQCECAEGEASQQHRGQVSSSPGEASQLQQQSQFK